MRNLNIALVQTELTWQDPPANRARLERAVEEARGADLVLLPEMFATGFTMEPQACAEDMDGPTVEWLRAQAASTGAAVGGSLAMHVDGGYRNRFLLATPDGALQHYDKRHLFRMAGEQNHYVAGAERVVFAWQGWRLCAQVCYDLRFPVWSRNRGDYDALLYVANWPARRREHWRALLVARAIENQCFVLGVNRTGLDGKGIEYAGDSLVIDPWGRVLCDPQRREGVHAAMLEAATLEECREKFPVHLDADAFDLPA
jgi:predicted amidohydrolase